MPLHFQRSILAEASSREKRPPKAQFQQVTRVTAAFYPICRIIDPKGEL
jgi:hypothetical protein